MLLKAHGLYVFGPYRLDPRERQLLRDGETVSLPPKAFDLLVALVSRAGRLATKEELLAEVWPGTFVEEANLSYTISLLRRTLGDEAERYIETVPKRGYRFREPVKPLDNAAAAVGPAPPAYTTARRRTRWRWIAAAIVLGLLGGAVWSASRLGKTDPGSTEVISAPLTSFAGLERMPDLSADGTKVAYEWDGRRSEADASNWDIYVQLVDAGDPHRLTSHPARDFAPVWSPDGLQVAFLRQTGDGRATVHIVPSFGGSERRVSPREVVAGGLDWSPDALWLAVTLRREGLTPPGIGLVSLKTGDVRVLTSPSAAVDIWPRFSPDGQAMAFVRDQTISGPSGDLYLVPVGGGPERRLTFDERGIWGHDWTSNGKELVFSSNRGGHWTLWRIETESSQPAARSVAGVGTDALRPTVARKSGRLAYNEWRQDHDIWRVPISPAANGSRAILGIPRPVPGSTRAELSPQVSPDGRRLVFVSRRGGDQAIWVSDIDGSNALQIAAFPGYPSGSPRWSPDSQRIAFDAFVAGHADIFVVGTQGGEPERVTSEGPDGNNVVPSWSRDEQWIYFASNRSGRMEVWKLAASGGPAIQITRGGGFAPFESHDGRFIYYLKAAGIGGIWRVPVEGGEETPVIDGPPAGFWGYWALLAGGIYFATQEGDAPALVKYYEFATKGTNALGYLDAPAIRGTPFFEVSPDGRWIFYVKSKPATSDIILVKNFR